MVPEKKKEPSISLSHRGLFLVALVLVGQKTFIEFATTCASRLGRESQPELVAVLDSIAPAAVLAQRAAES